MARESISKIAYKTLQQSKSIAGFAHKQISSRIMNFILPDSKLENFKIDKDLLSQIQSSMDYLREEDWNDAENNFYPKKLLFCINCSPYICSSMSIVEIKFRPGIANVSNLPS